MNMRQGPGMRNRSLWLACVSAGSVALFAPADTASAQTIQLYPIRIAPLGSPAGTVGDPVTPTFNDALDCWELRVPGGVEVDIDVQGGGWGNFAGNPYLGHIQATIGSDGYSNGTGADLNPKGWPADPGRGAYQAMKVCGAGGNGDPASPPFDTICTGNGFTIDNPDFIFRPYMNANVLAAIFTSTLDYGYAVAAQDPFDAIDPDPDSFGTFGGLILEVPTDAAGTYVIAVDPDPNNSYMWAGEPPTDIRFFTATCITVIEGACCLDTDSDEFLNSCQGSVLQTECENSGGLFVGHESTCSGSVGACCLSGDDDDFNETCVVTDSVCCDVQGGSFLGEGAACGNAQGACWLDSDGDGFQDTCRTMDQPCCAVRDGTFRGGGSRCNEATGACCLDFDRVCLEIDLTSCVEQHGRFQGFGISCSGDADGDGKDDACGEVIPAVSDWGLITLTLLLLVGGKMLFGIDRGRIARR